MNNLNNKEGNEISGIHENGHENPHVIHAEEKVGTPADAATVEDLKDEEGPTIDEALKNGLPKDQSKEATLPDADKELIQELKSKTDVWMRWYNFSGWIYWVMGAASVAFSCLGASDVVDSSIRPICALLSAICLGVIGFANPQKKAAKFIGAYRLLEPSVRAYKYGIMSKADLLVKDKEAENMLNEGDFDGK